MRSIEATDPTQIRTDATIGLAFPVAFQSTFPFLWRFFKAMPKGDGVEVFMIDTMMAFSGAIVGPLRKLLARKGYQCIGAKEIVMPSNWFPQKIDPKKNEVTRQKGIAETRTYALDLLQGTTSWGRLPILSDLLYLLCCNRYMMTYVNTAPGKRIGVNNDVCKGCGLCVQLCPVQNITLNGSPQWMGHCETCMRCLCFCPAGAVYIADKEFVHYKAVSAKELVPG